MKEYVIEIVIDDKGNLYAETKGMQGEVCVKELDNILTGVEGERKITNTGDYYQTSSVKQTVTTKR